MSDTDDKQSASAALILALGASIGDSLFERMKHEHHMFPDPKAGTVRDLPTFVSGPLGGFPAPAGVIRADRPRQGYVWEIRFVSIWVGTPHGNQNGVTAALHVGNGVDTASAGNGVNAECTIPAQALPFFQHFGSHELVVRNGEELYAVLSTSAQGLGFMTVLAIEFDETEYPCMLVGGS